MFLRMRVTLLAAEKAEAQSGCPQSAGLGVRPSPWLQSSCSEAPCSAASRSFRGRVPLCPAQLETAPSDLLLPQVCRFL